MEPLSYSTPSISNLRDCALIATAIESIAINKVTNFFIICRFFIIVRLFVVFHNIHNIKKARESVTVARLAHRGLRIARYSRTSNAEAHADMYICPSIRVCDTDIMMAVDNTHLMGIYRCLAPTVHLKFAKFLCAEDKASSKRLFLYVIPFVFRPVHITGFSVLWNNAKICIYSRIVK